MFFLRTGSVSTKFKEIETKRPPKEILTAITKFAIHYKIVASNIRTFFGTLMEKHT